MNRKQRFKIIAGSIIISCLILISITLCLISVFIKDFTHDKHLYSETANYELNDILLNVGSSTFYITSETPEGTIFELMEASVDSPLAISWNSNQQISVSINGKELDTDDEIKIEKISNYDLVDLNISYGNFNKQYFIRTLPEDFPKLKITGQTEYAGDFYGDLASSSQNEYFYIYKYSTSGVLKYFKASSVLIRNFRKWEIDGTSYYTYFEETPEYNNLSDGAYSQGQYIVMDSAYNIIDMVNILDSDSKNIVSEYTEQHEFTMLGLNHYILIAYVVRNPNIEHCNGTLSPGTRITAAYLQEIKNDEIIWDWISTDYPEFYTGYVESDSYINVDYSHSIDYFHINSLNIDPLDNNIIISARNQDSIIKISRKDGHIIWILGGPNDQFGLTDAQKFSRQHFASYVKNGNLLLFDNGYEREISRILEISLDEKNKKINTYEEFSLGIFGKWCGSVQKIDPDKRVYCIGWGMKLGSYSLMSLVDFDSGQVISEIIGASKDLMSYRICFY